MLTPVGEPVAVLGSYAHATFSPRKFKWRERVFSITEVTFVTDVKDGGVKKRTYSVLSGGTLYRLEFNRDTEDWCLAEIWCE